jgi:hypothetical protein
MTLDEMKQSWNALQQERESLSREVKDLVLIHGDKRRRLDIVDQAVTKLARDMSRAIGRNPDVPSLPPSPRPPRMFVPVDDGH